MTYSDGLDRIESIRSDGRIEGPDPGMAALTGRVDVRFAESTLITQAIDGTPCELVVAWSLGANASFTFFAHAVYLESQRRFDRSRVPSATSFFDRSSPGTGWLVGQPCPNQCRFSVNSTGRLSEIGCFGQLSPR